MKKITAVLAASALIASSTFAFAGGPVEIQDEDEPVVVIATPSSGSLGNNALLVGGGFLVLCALACNSDSGSH